MHTAHLRCGVVLSFGAPSFLPDTGEAVPCPRHGYCLVDATGRSGAPARRRSPRTASPRSQTELLEWLRHHPQTTVHALRRQRFTLRLVVAAAREGLAEVDLHTGVVTTRQSGTMRAPE